MVIKLATYVLEFFYFNLNLGLREEHNYIERVLIFFSEYFEREHLIISLFHIGLKNVQMCLPNT